MVERLSPSTAVRLSPELTSELRGGIVTPELVNKIENATQAYFICQPECFIGLRVGEAATGPETPCHRPKEPDQNPIVQAIAQIGDESRYWKNVAGGIESHKADVANFIQLSELIAFMNPDGSSTISVSTDQANILFLIKTLFNTNNLRYPAFIKLTNYCGDGDFFGLEAENRKIFPKKIRGTNVIIDELGILSALAATTWKSWETMLNAYRYSYHEAVLELFNRTDLPLNTLTFLGSYMYGKKFSGPYDIEKATLNNFDIESTKFVIHAANENVTRLIYFDDDPYGLLRSTQLLAANLDEMYETARIYRQDVYKY